MASADTYVIVGAGVFGASTALDLARAGKQVVVLDRSTDGYCAPDAASNDLNKIVRADYSDAHYRDLAKSAISIWRRSEILSPFYHETGVLFHTGAAANGQEGQAYIDTALRAAQSPSHRELPHIGQRLKPHAHTVQTEEEVKECFPVQARSRLGNVVKDVSGRANGNAAYFNPRGGWAEANRATRAVLDEAKRLGATVVGKAHVQSLLFDEADHTLVKGVRCTDGRTFRTSGQGSVVLCAGSWSERLVSSLLGESSHSSIPRLSVPSWSSAQCVVTVQLSEEQRRAFAGCPVVLEFASGFYVFEPDENGLMKIAVHSAGSRYPLPPADAETPLTFPTFASTKSQAESAAKEPSTNALPAHVVKQDHIPADQTQRMLKHLQYIYPELASAPVVYERVCFYSESLDENWIIDRVPNVKGLVVACGDSGHAFKFLPLLGSLVCARLGIEQAASLTEHQERVFSFDYHTRSNQQSALSLRESSSFKARL